MEKIKTLLITQARMGSTRLPGKILLKINGQELLKIHLERIQKSKKVDKVIVATTVDKADNITADFCSDLNVEFYRGSVNDVLDRFYQAALPYQPKWVVRVTSDCPLLDSDIVDATIALAQLNDVDYAANILTENFPDGQDVEVFKFSALEKAWTEARLSSEREHVTTYIRKNTTYNGGLKFSSVNLPCFDNFNEIRMTVDEIRDLELMDKLIEEKGANLDWLTYTKYIIEKKLTDINGDIIRNEGLLKSINND